MVVRVRAMAKSIKAKDYPRKLNWVNRDLINLMFELQSTLEYAHMYYVLWYIDKAAERLKNLVGDYARRIELGVDYPDKDELVIVMERSADQLEKIRQDDERRNNRGDLLELSSQISKE